MYNECRHIFTSGKRCQSPALRDQDFCYFHQANRQRANTSRRSGQPSTLVHHLPPLEDADAIQLAISDVVLALAANRIDPRRAQILIYGLQVASQNNRQRHAIETAEGDRPERSRRVREAHEHQDGSLVAPPRQQPDPEDIPEKEAPSLGRILLKEAEALKAQKAENAESAGQPVSLQLPHLHATADIPPAKSSHLLTEESVGRRRIGISREPYPSRPLFRATPALSEAAGMRLHECPHNRIPAIPLILAFEERPLSCKEG